MPWFAAKVFDSPERQALELAARESRRFVDRLTKDAAFDWVRARVDQEWMQECCIRLGPSCVEHLGLFNLIGPDAETLFPAYVMLVTRIPWKYGQEPATGNAAIYREPDGEAESGEPRRGQVVCVEIGPPKEWQRIT